MANGSLARRYARALIGIGTDENCIDQIGADLAAFDHPAAVVVNTAVDFDASRYALQPSATLLVGHPYIPLRRDIREAIPSVVPDPADSHRIVLTFGAADFSGLSLPVAEGLVHGVAQERRGQPYTVDVICGPAVPNSRRNALEAFARCHETVRLHTDVERMAEVVLGARLVVSAAGSTTWELLALGIPVLSVAVSENQRQ